LAAPKVCVVVPTYNERENVRRVVQAVKDIGLDGLTLLFVDDSSPDGTEEAIREAARGELWVKVLVRKERMGLGSAYQDGFREAISAFSPDIFIEMDADLQHPPAAIPGLVRAIEEGADVAVGSRYVEGGSISGWSLGRRVISRGANSFARILLGLPVRDSTSGFRAYNKRTAETICSAKRPGRGFAFQVAWLKALKTEMKIVEVPYQFTQRAAGISKFGVGDMWRFFLAVLGLAFGWS